MICQISNMIQVCEICIVNLGREILGLPYYQNYSILFLFCPIDLSAYMFCPLSQPSVLHWVLSTAVQFPINFFKLRLCHNGIRQLKIEVLNKASYLRTLDISHNEVC